MLAIEQSSPPDADILPAAGLVRNLSAALCLRELHLCRLHLLHPVVLCDVLASLRLLRVLVLDYVEAYEQVSPELAFVMASNALEGPCIHCLLLPSAHDSTPALHGVARLTQHQQCSKGCQDT